MLQQATKSTVSFTDGGCTLVCDAESYMTDDIIDAIKPHIQHDISADGHWHSEYSLRLLNAAKAKEILLPRRLHAYVEIEVKVNPRIPESTRTDEFELVVELQDWPRVEHEDDSEVYELVAYLK